MSHINEIKHVHHVRIKDQSMSSMCLSIMCLSMHNNHVCISDVGINA